MQQLVKSAAPIRRILNRVMGTGNRAGRDVRGLGTFGSEGPALFQRMNFGPRGLDLGRYDRHLRMPGGMPDQFERAGTLGMEFSGSVRIGDSLARLRQSIARAKAAPPPAPVPPPMPPPPGGTFPPPGGMPPPPPNPMHPPGYAPMGPPPIGAGMPPQNPYMMGGPPGMLKQGAFAGVLTKIAASASPLGAMPVQNSAMASPLQRAAATPPTSPAAGAAAVGELTSAADMVALAPAAPAPPPSSAIAPTPQTTPTPAQ
jgi:hypothetical protein